jgi:hypothetical protein
VPSFQTANYLEAALWTAIGLTFLGFARGAVRTRCLLAAVVFIVFGGSDVVEASTGAWWRPWWLLLWKALCLTCMLALLVDHVIRTRRARKSQ